MKWWMTLTFDFEKNLLIPNLKFKKILFTDQLINYVFDIHCPSCLTCDYHVYLWSEFTGERGADEVLSCLEQEVADLGPEEHGGAMILMADNCKGQNKYQFIIGWAHEHTDPKSIHFTYQ